MSGFKLPLVRGANHGMPHVIRHFRQRLLRLLPRVSLPTGTVWTGAGIQVAKFRLPDPGRISVPQSVIPVHLFPKPVTYATPP